MRTIETEAFLQAANWNFTALETNYALQQMHCIGLNDYDEPSLYSGLDTRGHDIQYWI